MNNNIDKIKKLRQVSGMGIADCKNALKKTEYDFDLAVLELKKLNKKIYFDKNDRFVKCGKIYCKLSDTSKKFILFKVCTETDFVLKSDHFNNIINKILIHAYNNNVSDMKMLLSLKINNESVHDILISLVSYYREKIEIIDLKYLNILNGCLVVYNHDNRIVSCIHVFNNNSLDKVKDIAMQVVALNAKYISWKDIPEDIILQEKKVILDKVHNQYKNKSKKIIDGIINGMLKKSLDPYVLHNQDYIKDSNIKVLDFLISNNINILSFYRYEVKN